MSGRPFLVSARRLSTISLVGCVALWAAPTLAQGVADAPDAPVAPAEPPVAPPAPDPPASAPSEPAPPSQAPPSSEPVPAPTLTPAPVTTPAPEGDAPKPESAAASAAFAPLAAEAHTPPAKPQAKSVAPAAATAPSSAQTPKDDDGSGGGLLGPFRIGVLVGTGLPEVVSFGAQLKLTRFFGAGVNVGIIPTVRIKYYGEAAQKYQEYDVYGHIYPFGGSFFLGTGVGYEQIDGTLYSRVNLADVQPGFAGSVDLNSEGSVRTLVLTPQIGFLKIFDVGFAIGIDIGAQIPIAPSEVHFNTVATIPPQYAAAGPTIQSKYIDPSDEKVRHTLDTLGRTPLPTFNFKIGWFL